ncbi:MAG: FtsW/RodA/SpoVE family cell cycle protein [Waltera sp.]
MYIGNLVLLGLVILMGEEGNGAQRWLKIGGLQFQPSRTCKNFIDFILCTVYYEI